MLRSEKTRTTSDNDFRLSPSVEGRRRLESGASVTVERFVGRSQSLTAGATGEFYINRGATAWPMAKRKYSTMKRNKIEPSVQTLTFSQLSNPVIRPANPNTSYYYFDLSQIASLANRRFYRQGINWAVAGFKIVSQTQGTFTVQKLPNTWVMSNAWEKSFRTWTRMNNEALAETESVRPRFLDFKIYADDLHHANGFAINQLPDSAMGTYQAGEWEASKASIPLVSPAGAFLPGETVEREFIAVGANYPGVSPVTTHDALSLIEGYAASRGLPNIADPNTPDDASDVGGGTPENWMQAIFNEGTDQASDVLEDMVTENNIAPYPFENDGVNADTMYPGGANQGTGLQIHDITQVTPTTIGGITRMKGGNFPCGLVCLSYFGTETPNILLQIDLIPGNHRGYLCESMTEM